MRLCTRAALARTKQKRSLRNGKLKASRSSATEDRGTKGRRLDAFIRKKKTTRTAPGHSQKIEAR